MDAAISTHSAAFSIDGITEEILTALSQVSELKVAGARSVYVIVDES